MLTSALLLMLTSVDVQPSFLSMAPRAARLVSLEGIDSTVTIEPKGRFSAGAPKLKPADLPSYKGWSVVQLLTEYDRLEDIRPGIAFPLTLLLTGLTGLAVSFFAYAISLGGFRGASMEATVTFALGSTTSAAMVAFGGIQLYRGGTDRRHYGIQMERVERLIDEHERDERLFELWEQRYGPAAPPPPIIGPTPTRP